MVGPGGRGMRQLLCCGITKLQEVLAGGFKVWFLNIVYISLWTETLILSVNTEPRAVL